MTASTYDPEFAANPAQRCPVVLVLDTSGSMSGPRINELNAGLRAYCEAIRNDDTASVSVETAIVTFGPVRLLHDFSTAFNLELPSLEADGLTPLGEALDFALDHLEQRRRIYSDQGIPYYRPWVILMTDGAPDSDDAWQQAAHRIRTAEAKRKLSFFAIGVQGANMKVLSEIAPEHRPPLMLQGLKFREFFLWLSASVQAVSHSQGSQEQVSLADLSGWTQVGVN